MKQPTLFHGLLTAASLTLGSSVLISISAFLRWSPFALFGPLLVGLLYLVCLFLIRPRRAGVLTMFLLAGLLQIVAAAMGLRLILFVPLLCMTWTAVRAVCWYRHVRQVAGDLVLGSVACVVAGWCLITFRSVTLAVWCFFLVNGLWVMLLEEQRSAEKPNFSNEERKHSARFAGAYAAALKVLR